MLSNSTLSITIDSKRINALTIIISLIFCEFYNIFRQEKDHEMGMKIVLIYKSIS